VPSLVTSLKKSLRVNKRRHVEVTRLVKKLGRQDFERRHPDAKFGPVLALIASYLEADNIGPVLKAVPHEVDGLEVTTLVVVDGGDDGTEDIVEGAGALCAVLPINMGQGVAFSLAMSWPRHTVAVTWSPSMPTARTTPEKFPSFSRL